MQRETDEVIASRALSKRQTGEHAVSWRTSQETSMEHEPAVTPRLHARDLPGRITAQRSQQ